MNIANLRQAFQATASTLGIIVGLVAAGFMASLFLDPSISWGEATSWATDRMPFLNEFAAYVVANQALTMVAFYGLLLLLVAGSLAYRRRDDQRIAADRAAAAVERRPGCF